MHPTMKQFCFEIDKVSIDYNLFSSAPTNVVESKEDKREQQTSKRLRLSEGSRESKDTKGLKVGETKQLCYEINTLLKNGHSSQLNKLTQVLKENCSKGANNWREMILHQERRSLIRESTRGFKSPPIKSTSDSHLAIVNLHNSELRESILVRTTPLYPAKAGEKGNSSSKSETISTDDKDENEISYIKEELIEDVNQSKSPDSMKLRATSTSGTPTMDKHIESSQGVTDTQSHPHMDIDVNDSSTSSPSFTSSELSLIDNIHHTLLDLFTNPEYQTNSSSSSAKVIITKLWQSLEDKNLISKELSQDRVKYDNLIKKFIQQHQQRYFSHGLPRLLNIDGSDPRYSPMTRMSYALTKRTAMESMDIMTYISLPSLRQTQPPPKGKGGRRRPTVAQTSPEPSNAAKNKRQLTVRALIDPLVLPVPKYVTWCPLPHNLRAEDEKILRSFPYFGDSDEDGCDLNCFDADPKNLDPELRGEVEEAVFLHMIEKHADVIKSKETTVNIPEALLQALRLAHKLFHKRVYQLREQYLKDLYKRLADGRSVSAGYAAVPEGHPVYDEIKKRHLLRMGSPAMVRLFGFPKPVHLNNDIHQNQLGVRDSKSWGYIVDNFRDLFCPRCCVYDCLTHGINHPQPISRKDPPQPFSCPVPGFQQQRKRHHSKAVLEINSEGDEKISSFPKALYRNLLSPPAHLAQSDSKSALQSPSKSSTGISVNGSSEGRTPKLRPPPTRNSPLPRPIQSSTLLEKTSSSSELEASPLSWRDMEVAIAAKLVTVFGKTDNESIARALGTRSVSEVEQFLDFQRRGILEIPSLDTRSMAKYETHRIEADLSVDGQSSPTTSTTPGGNVDDNLNYNNKGKKRSQSTYAVKSTTVRYEYEACSHEGPCSSANEAVCKCASKNGYCEKYCACDRSCRRRFPGCNCGAGRCQSNFCPCYCGGRECDPDLCQKCGACIDPKLLLQLQDFMKNTKANFPMCLNCPLATRKQGKAVAVGRSSVHGWGLFALENINKNDFIIEYSGELISQDEANRRGIVYDKLDFSFLFQLNDDLVIDATRKGNITKFVNHSAKSPNCFARVPLVNTDHRIEFIALRPIAAGEELTFNYKLSENTPEWLKKKHQNMMNQRKKTQKESKEIEEKISLKGLI